MKASAASALAAAIFGTGCAFGDGDPFGELEATLDARYELLPERDRGEDWQKLNTDFEARVTSLELSVITIDLQDTAGAGVAGELDPENPPPGYSLCHNGHCHRDDGALVAYEDIAAGEAAAPSTAVAALAVGELDLAAGVSRNLDCAETCLLPRGHIGRARLFADRLTASGEVRDGRATPRITGALPWTFSSSDLDPTDATVGVLDVALDIPVDRDEPARIRIDLTLRATAKLLDGVAFDEVATALGATEPLQLDAHEDTSAKILERFAELELGASVARSDE